MFIEPMYASPMPKRPITIAPGMWALEEKYDGIRLILQKHVDEVTGWSRYGNKQFLPPHIREMVERFPNVILDGELLVPGLRSYGAREIANRPDLVYVVFDLLRTDVAMTTDQTYDERRQLLDHLAAQQNLTSQTPVRLAPVWQIKSEDDVNVALTAIWKRDGEGAILKRRLSRYLPGKRPSGVWVKFKALRSDALTIIGFLPSQGEVVNRGPYATVVLQDSEGYRVTVKTRNDVELERLNGVAVGDPAQHPWIGRRLRIEYQERTPDGSYRHPRWDRYEDE